jgi:hypothetical protein
MRTLDDNIVLLSWMVNGGNLSSLPHCFNPYTVCLASTSLPLSSHCIVESERNISKCLRHSPSITPLKRLVSTAEWCLSPLIPKKVLSGFGTIETAGEHANPCLMLTSVEPRLARGQQALQQRPRGKTRTARKQHIIPPGSQLPRVKRL